jgi:SAM-dependent methyltransferase
VVSEGAVTRLNWGCGQHPEPGWVNSDLKEGPGIDISCDIRGGIPLDDGSFDYIVSIHALPMISYPDLVPVLQELRRLLKPGGVLRLSLPDVRRGIRAFLDGDREYFMVPDEDVRSLGGKFVVHMLWYGYSVTMFTDDFIEELLEKARFSRVTHCRFRRTASRWPDIVDLDNRENESLFVEAVK